MNNKIENINFISLQSIYPNPLTSFNNLSSNDLSEEIETIKKYGFSYPIIVSRRHYLKNTYLLISGELTYKAAICLKLSVIPSLVIPEYIPFNSITQNNKQIIFKSNQKSIPVIKDIGFFTNSIKHSIDIMKLSGINITYTLNKFENNVIYTITISNQT